MRQDMIPPDDHKLLAEVADLYYREKMNQQEIGARLGISRSMISRYLARAEESGVVEIIIHYPDYRVRALERRLREAFGLTAARVCRSGVGNDAAYLLAAEYLQEELHDNAILDVAWGRAVTGVYRAIRPKRKMPSLRVVQAFGSAMPNQEVDGTAIIGGMAALLGGSAVYLHTPLHVGNAAVRDNLLKDPNISSVLRLAESADMVLTGIGDVGATSDTGGSWMHYLTRKEEKELRKMGTVGHVCTRHFDIDGKYLDIPAYKGIVGISHESYMRIKLRIAMAVGKEKVDAILGALRGKYINALITDEETATRVLARAEQA